MANTDQTGWSDEFNSSSDSINSSEFTYSPKSKTHDESVIGSETEARDQIIMDVPFTEPP